jgi:hypothetical protein
MSDPFPSELCGGTWNSIRGSKVLTFMGGDRMLEWEPPSGNYRLWRYDNSYSQGDPLPGGPIDEGNWGSIRGGHELVYLFEDRLLDWEPGTGHFRIWQFNRNGGGDPLPNVTCEGTWGSIRQGHKLIYIDGDQVLDWEYTTGNYRLWQYDRNNSSDPFPGSPLVQGHWRSIQQGHELVYLSKNRMLDWEPNSGSYRVWSVQRSGNDVLPNETASGSWNSIRGQHRLIRVAEDQCLDWEPENGRYRVWRVSV